jgi:polysaccharide biosynthesis/export protein
MAIVNAEFIKYSIVLLLLNFICSYNTLNAQPTGTGTNPFQNPYGQVPPRPKKTEPSKPTSENAEKQNTEKTAKESKPESKTDREKATKTKVENEEQTEISENKENVDEYTKDEIAGGASASLEKPASESIYGSSFFSNANIDFGSRYATSPPPSYKLGPGDELVINAWGYSETQARYTIGRDGAIYPDKIGKINIAGLNLENAERIISNRYKQILAQGTQVQVQLGKSRSIKITIMGEVRKPGTLTISAFNTAFNAINFAGGVTDLANLRSIEIRRDGRQINAIDLYEFLKTGNVIDDAYLEDGDILFIGNAARIVKAEGKFKRPMFYVLKDDENLNDLIDLAGGPTFDARFSSVQVQTVVNEESKLYTINLNDLRSGTTVLLKDGDIVKLKSINSQLNNTIEIQGAVNYPDVYQIKSNDRLLDIIDRAGGLRPDALTNNAFVYRGDTSLNTGIIKVNLMNIDQSNSSENIEVFPGDFINIVSKTDFLNIQSVSINGEVRKPGSFKYFKDMSLKSLILLSGGLRPEAEITRIELSRLKLNTDVNDTNNYTVLSYQFKATQDLDYNIELEKILIQPFDKIYIRRNPFAKVVKTMSVYGEVKFPGEYTINNANETISSIINRAGGITKYAYLNGATFTRLGFGQIIINLPEIVSKPNSKYDLLVNNLDSIYIPTQNQLVTVEGQVQQAINVMADKEQKSTKYYINAAGGWGERPWKDRVSVRYPNGKFKATKRIFFVRKYPKVIPGCLVIVPTKPNKKESSFTWRDTQGLVTSVLATVSSLSATFGILVGTGVIKLPKD